MNRKTSTLISLGISVALIAAGILFLYHHQNHMGYGANEWIMPHHMMIWSGMGIIMNLFWGVLLAAVVLLILGLVTRMRFAGERNGKQLVDSDALNILKQRYASGAISKRRFEEMWQDLR